MRSLFLATLLILSSPPTEAAKSSCKESLYSGSARLRNIVEKNDFDDGEKVEENRDLNQYKISFSGKEYILNKQKNSLDGEVYYSYSWIKSKDPRAQFSFGSKLRTLYGTAEKHWLDSGGGNGKATSQFLSGNSNKNFHVTLVSYRTNKTTKKRYKVIKGEYFEKVDELEPADILSDSYGTMAYTKTPHIVLDKYLSTLKKDGLILLNLGAAVSNNVIGFEYISYNAVFGLKNKVIKKNGEAVSLFEWIRTIPGLKVRLFENEKYKIFFATIEIEDRNLIQIPNLELVHIGNKDTPPFMIFTEDGLSQSRIKKAIKNILWEREEDLSPGLNWDSRFDGH